MARRYRTADQSGIKGYAEMNVSEIFATLGFLAFLATMIFLYIFVA